MDLKEIINQQITILAQLNDQLLTHGTPEAGREIRENAMTMADLAQRMEQLQIAELVARVAIVEDVLFRDKEPDTEALTTSYGYQKPLIQYTVDCREDLDSVFEWMEKLEMHLDLDEDWADEYEAGE